MLNKIKITKSDSLDYSSVSLFVAVSAVISLINFTYNAYLGRRLDLTEFGIITLISSLNNLITVPLSSFSKAVTKEVSYYLGKYKTPAFSWWQKLRLRSLVAGTTMTMLWLVSIPLLKNMFKVDSFVPFLLVAPIWLISVNQSLDSGFLSGLHKFKQLAFITFIQSIVLFLITILLVEVSFSDYIYIAIPVSYLTSFLLGWIFITQTSRKTKKSIPENISFPWPLFGSSFVTKLSSVLFINIDVFFAKYYLTPEQAGEYALLALVGKMIYFGSTLIGQFIIPAVGREIGEGKNPRNVFLKLFIPSAGIVSLAYIVVGPFGNLSAPFLFGEKALAIVPYLVWYNLGMVCFGISNMLVNYYQSKSSYKITYASLFTSLFIILGLIINHDSIEDFSAVMTWGGILSIIFVVIFRVLIGINQHYLSIFISRILGVFSNQSVSKNFRLPKKIKDYHLLSEIDKDSSIVKNYRVGIYLDNSGKKYFVKVWKGSYKSASYWELLNEITINTILSRRQQKNSTFYNIPRLVDHINTDTKLIMISEWVESKELEVNKIDYSKLHGFISGLTKEIRGEDYHQLPKRDSKTIVLLYPVLVVKSLTVFPRKTLKLIQAAFVFAKNYHEILAKKKLVLTHRDLNSSNVIISEKSLYIIDFSFAVLAPEGYEDLTSLRLVWDNPVVKEELLLHISNKINTRKDFRYYQALGIYVSSVQLITKFSDKDLNNKHFEFLAFWSEEAESYFDFKD